MGRSVINPGDGDDRHGTWNGYKNLACRCASCCQANSEAHYKYMRSDPARLERHRIATQQYRARLKEEKNNGN